MAVEQLFTWPLDLFESYHQRAIQKASRPESFRDPLISNALLMKAANQNDQLTKIERLLILSLCDVPGKALARPESITDAERNLILGRPPPDMLAATIKKVTDGAMSTIAELETDHAKSLREPGLRAIMDNYWTKETRLFRVETKEFHSYANKAAMMLVARPSEQALQREALSRLADLPLHQPKLLSAAGEVDHVSGRLAEQGDNISYKESEAIQEGRRAELVHANMMIKKEMEGYVEAEIKALSENELRQLEKLRSRMILEVVYEVKADIEEGERKALERKNEEDELLEERRKWWEKAAGPEGATAEPDGGDQVVEAAGLLSHLKLGL